MIIRERVVAHYDYDRQPVTLFVDGSCLGYAGDGEPQEREVIVEIKQMGREDKFTFKPDEARKFIAMLTRALEVK